MFSHTKPPAGTQINPLHPLSRGLVGCWLFNEGAGSLANDISGNKNHGRLTNMAPNVQGSAWGNGGLEFNGVDDNIDCGNDASLDITDAITVEAWVYSSWDQSDKGIVGKYIGSTGYLLFAYPTGSVSWQVDGSTNRVTTVVTPNVWNHIVGLWNGTNVELFVNGVSKGIDTGSLTSNVNNLIIGKYLSVANFNGLIDSVRIYNRALSAEEVAWSYREPYAMFEPSFNPALLYSAAPPVGAIMNQFQKANIGADLYNGVLI